MARFAAGSRTAAARRPYPRKRGHFAPESGVRSASRPYPLIFDVMCCVWVGMNSKYTVGGVGFLQDGLHFFDRISNARPSPQHERKCTLSPFYVEAVTSRFSMPCRAAGGVW